MLTLVSDVPVELVAAGETDRGSVRESNEDALLVRTDLGLYVVADGAGGHNAGNVASAMATTAVAKHVEAAEPIDAEKPERDIYGLWTAARTLAIAVQRANSAVIEIAQTSNKYRGMGTTIVCALFTPETGRLHLAHAGDSRCYRLRGGALDCLTIDHSILTDVVEQFPGIDDEALARLPRKAVTRALGMEDSLRVSMRSCQSQPGDRYLLCSDGLTGELTDAMLAELLNHDAPPAEIARELIARAKAAGGRDNVTALVVECRPTRGPSERAGPPGGRKAALTIPDYVITPDGAPEIVLLRSQGRPKDETSDPAISVVAVGKMDEKMIRALDQVAPILGGARKCGRCAYVMEASAVLCPRCGFSNEAPPA